MSDSTPRHASTSVTERPTANSSGLTPIEKNGDFATKKLRRKHRPIGAYVAVGFLLLIFLFPLLYLANTALKSSQEFITNPVGIVTSPQWSNFSAAWNTGDFGDYIANTVLYTLAGAAIGTFIALVMGFPVSRGYIKGGKLWNALFVFVLFLPNALVTQFHLLRNIGLYDNRIGYILMVGVGVGIGPLLFSGFAKSIPTELDEAAAIDGIGYWRYLFTFIFPLARPALATIFILQAVWIWNEVILATVLFFDSSKWPIATGLNAFKGAYSNNWTLLAAATLIVAAPLIVGYVFIQKYLVNGVVGAVKG
ncbi:carbohydrate ABC transporter permease [Rarobacter faecitabidus]|uniref:Carbohydrate ABC transporter membrane protein 2 (CUT1 family) n=1 Tax=Rarobacter faecitabidus TaxID=13243 RepID=A0A542ZAQ8_RARFA|nr:carbohydrate ABC transporter permease [Rarobacter faecitabidus]TQL57414.1 carbohydrate ABC transporter membrane protein 2 (CUT1 family) [Rarobacter faecitabidus]